MKNKPKEKRKFEAKPFAFFSGVFDTVVAISIFALGFYIMSQVWGAVSHENEAAELFSGMFMMPIMIIVFLIFAVGGLLFLIMGILTLVSSFKSDKRNFNGLLITVAVFDVLLLFPSIFLIYIQSGTGQICSIVLTVLLGVGFVFKIIDIVLTKKRLKKAQQQQIEEDRKNLLPPNFDGLKEENEEQKTENNNDVDFSKLGK